MSSKLLAALAACACACAPASAQRAAFSSGITSEARRDASASPLAYSGFGWSAEASFEHAGESRIRWRAAFSHTLLSPASPLIASRQALTRGTISAAVLPWNAIAAWNGALAIGALLDLSGQLASHRYISPSGFRNDFPSALLSISPQAEWRGRAPGGTAQVSLTIPLVGALYRPWSPFRDHAPPPAIRMATPALLRGGAARIDWEERTTRRIAFRATWIVDASALRLPQPVSEASQSLRLGAALRLGSSMESGR